MALKMTVEAALVAASAMELTSKISIADGMLDAASITAAEEVREAAFAIFSTMIQTWGEV